ncbi:hypothetical protein [Sporosarcina sp. FSL K6-2383]|uniref:hypothetical protein n=1 Tax=Sporosarcina sp. FSL K6-2383 TaxID=2921556 RepID=UPI00315A29BD
MGYLLPIQPIQSQQYANRMNADSYNFAHINRVGKIKFDFKFSEDSHEAFQQDQEQEEKEEKEMASARVSAPPLASKGFIYPNPANLSPAISQAVGKGLSVNAYV